MKEFLTALGHSEIDGGNADCCGCLHIEIDGESCKLTCNECGAVVATGTSRERMCEAPPFPSLSVNGEVILGKAGIVK